MSKSKMNDQILSYLVEIKEDIAGIKEHLKTLNGKVIRNVKEIERTKSECLGKIVVLENDSVQNKINWAKLSGVVLAVSTLGSILGNKILNLLWGM